MNNPNCKWTTSCFDAHLHHTVGLTWHRSFSPPRLWACTSSLQSIMHSFSTRWAAFHCSLDALSTSADAHNVCCCWIHCQHYSMCYNWFVKSMNSPLDEETDPYKCQSSLTFISHNSWGAAPETQIEKHLNLCLWNKQTKEWTYQSPDIGPSQIPVYVFEQYNIYVIQYALSCAKREKKSHCVVMM